MSKRAVILLGAGAPICWGAPFTSKITSDLFTSKEFLTKADQNLAEYVRDNLAEFYKREKGDIHFEYIINALETISDFLYEDLTHKNPPQFVGSKPAWFKLSEAYDIIENFRYEENRDGQGALFNLAKKGDTPDIAYTDGHKRQYILKALDEYLSIIRNAIGRYDYTCALTKYENYNKELFNFYSSLKDQGYTVRFYTTNYDDLFPNIFSLMGLPALYRGFDADKHDRLFPNIKKILIEDNIDCYYNLHGSIYWDRDTNGNLEYCFQYKPGMQVLTPQPYGEQTNPSERTIIYNIITGFNKLQKVSVEPLKAFFSSLSTDCVKADLISTVGYSYGDIHINRSLEYGVKHGNAKFLHITKSDNFLGNTEFVHMQSHTLKRRNYQDYKKDNNWILANDHSSRIYVDGFGEFLLKSEWKSLKEWM